MRWSPSIRALSWLIQRPIAHRGLHTPARRVIENSASAFAAAIAEGYAIECDLQLTADGEAVVFHDHALERLTESQGPVIAQTLRELQRLPLAAGPDRMQSLGELLDQTAGRVPLIVELKSRWDGGDALARRALTVLAPYTGPYALMSFDPDLLVALRHLSPRTVRGVVADRVTDASYAALPLARRLDLREMNHLSRSRPHFVSYQFDALPFNPVRMMHAKGMPVLSWTIRDEADAARARRYSDQITFEDFNPA